MNTIANIFPISLKTSIKTILLGCFIIASNHALAKEVYIADSFKAPFHTGPSNQYRIQNFLRTGVPLTVLDHDSKSGYTKVQTRKGTTGWVHKDHLTDQVIAKYRVKQLEAKLEKALNDKQNLISGQSDLQSATRELQRDNGSLNEINNKLVEELKYIKKISSNSIEINQRNQELIASNQQLQNEAELLKAENERLKDNSKQDFFLLGIGAVLLGMFASGVLPLLKPRKKDSDWV